MRRLSTQNPGVEKEKEKAKSPGAKKARSSFLSGDDFGRKAGEGATFGNGHGHENDIFSGAVDDLDDNPWASASSISTLRSRHHGRTSSRDFRYLHDKADSPPYASDGQREHGAETRRRRRRSRSAIASTSKHPLYVDIDDDDGDGYGSVDRHFNRTHSETQSISSHRGLSSPSDHRTRPSMRRAIGSLEGRADKDVDESAKGTEGSGDSNVDVIVHKVMRTDTLAGIALKYNIPLAQLRKANKLWTNDSIHLRQVLYIPLRDVTPSCSSSKILTSNPNAVLNSGEQHETSSPDFDHNTRPKPDTNGNDTQFTIPSKDEIRKVPHSQLSFFPPSGAGASGSSMSTSITSSIPNNNTRKTYSLSPTASSSPSFSFTSLLQGLNNATQEIKSRLSFDSYSRHSSDPGDDVEIELGSVRERIRRLAGVGEADGVLTAASPSAPAFAPDTPTVSSGRLQHQTRHFVDSSSSAPLPPPPTPQKAVIRSVQLQPSPEMKIPTRTSMDPRNDMKMMHLISGRQQQAGIESDTE